MNATIIYDGTGGKTLEFAAEELKGYLRRMCPEHLITINNKQESSYPIYLRCALGDGNETEGETDCYRLSFTREGGLIEGNHMRSVLLGVYGYLFRMGCRFLRPGRQYEKVPRWEKEHFLYLDEVCRASFRHRGVCIEGADSLEHITDFIDWLPKLGYNSFFIQFKLPYTFLARWYRHELNAVKAPEEFSEEKAWEYTRIMKNELARRDLMLHQVGHGWTGEAVGYKTADWKPVAAEPSEEQKAMMAMIDGTRGLYHGVPMNTNLCYSDYAVQEKFADLVAEYATEHPEVHFLHIWLADENNNICECQSCRLDLPSDQYVRILNLIDKKLTALGLKTRLVFLIYQELLWPPVKEKLENPNRFLLMFAPISRTFEESYRLKESYPDPPAYVRNQIVLPTNLDENMACLRGWQKVYPGDGFVYDYPLGRAHYGDLGYMHISELICKDIKKLEEIGLNGYMSCQELRCFLPNGFPNYVMGRMLFDSNLSFDRLKEEYFQAAYGPSYDRVIQYLSSLSANSSCDYFNGKGSRTDPEMAKKMKILQRQIREFWEDESGKPNLPDCQRFFWKILDYHREYSLRLGKAWEALAMGEKETAQELWREFQTFISGKEEEYQETLDVYRITEVSSKYTGFRLEPYLAKTL